MKSGLFLIICTLLITEPLFGKSNTDEKPPAAIPAVPVEEPPPSIKATPVELPRPSSKTKRSSASPLDDKGKIESLDVKKGIFVVHGKSFILSQKEGMVYVDGLKGSLSHLKAGDLVSVIYFEKSDGTNLATRVIKGYEVKKKKKASSVN